MIARIGVVVPVHDEQVRLPACLFALRAARDRVHDLGRRVDVRIVVVLDRCTDRSGAIAAAGGDLDVVRVDARNVGLARRAGVHRLLQEGGDRSRLWLANTDADSVVPGRWLLAMLTEADRGAHLVLGTVLPAAGLARRRRQLWRSLHTTQNGHPHVHGANFGIRADVYSMLGGWPPLPTGEDRQLADRAAGVGDLRIVRTGGCPVRTSARRHGRAPFGFASYLRRLDRDRHGPLEPTR